MVLLEVFMCFYIGFIVVLYGFICVFGRYFLKIFFGLILKGLLVFVCFFLGFLGKPLPLKLDL